MSIKDNSQNIALALGSNMGDRQAALRAAIDGFAPYVNVTAISKLYETAPAYVTDQPAFLNAAVLGTTKLLPMILLRAVKQLETAIGRQPTFRYGPRLLDIDILYYGDHLLVTPELTLPHPRMAEREFVLRPLADIIPNWKHPQSGLTVQEMLAKIPTLSPLCIGPLIINAA